MSHHIVFGRDRDGGVREAAVIAGEVKAGLAKRKHQSRAPKSNPLIPVYGPGPEGAKCKTCVHLVVQSFARNYYKCDLRRMSASAATDHRVNWPACGQYEREVPA